MILTDDLARKRATDPSQSYIVQAPAGSGKTEILTQRYLRLLARVEAPEHIVALTFTRKAANEMRERILKALQKADQGIAVTSPHEQYTQIIAKEALARDNLLGWNILQQPGRLRIATLDSLCQSITQSIVLQEKQIHYANISSQPQRLYLAASRACLAFAIENETYHNPLKILLEHLDNQLDSVFALFSDMLAHRDQWLPSFYQAKAQDKKTYEQALFRMEQHELTRFKKSIPPDCIDELLTLTRQLALIEANPDSPRFVLTQWQHIDKLDRHIAKSLSTLLLTSQNTWRKAFDHHVGLKRGVCDDKQYAELKERSKALLEKLSGYKDVQKDLLRVKNLPPPHYDPEQWEVLQALLTLLPLLAAHLQLIFNERNEVDFTAISDGALHALGDEENPTDLALYLDNTIHHLLIDEFQDTSLQQFQLLRQLVQGWELDDGRTLFVVGDPMQSIYRFRAAEVGLFLRAKEHGIGSVKLISLQLTSNFRSSETLVHWVNTHFPNIFPKNCDMESGAITFHPATPVHSSTISNAVFAFQHDCPTDEAEALIDLIQHELLTYSNDSIAILVRSRRQLAHIIPRLRAKNIPFEGVEIDLLAHLPHLSDVWSLTQALLMPASRLAWLAFLRSPWCGFSLSDLHALANVSKKKSIVLALSQWEEVAGLSEAGKVRAKFIHSVLENALARRHQEPLIDWIINTLKDLHLENILNESEQDSLEQFWQLLAQFEREGQIGDLVEFKRQFHSLYSKRTVPSRLKIMTIHKSKGLEFDCVMLPSLNSKPPSPDTPLLRMLKLPSEQHGELLLLSPMKAARHETCPLYSYLGMIDAQKNTYELQRLLYVAVTRAKKRLYLFDGSEKELNGTFRNLLQEQVFLPVEKKTPELSQVTDLPVLYHLPLSFYSSPHSNQNNKTEASSVSLIDTTPRLIGIAAHELLQWVCTHHPMSIQEVPWSIAKHRLRTMGFEGVRFADAFVTLQEQIIRLFNNPRGQWLIRAHENERNEYELLIDIEGECETRIIDRTFIEKGIRWIIDFKTGQDTEASLMNHREQLSEYARYLSEDPLQPICCGLYYLKTDHWVHWDYALSCVMI